MMAVGGETMAVPAEEEISDRELRLVKYRLSEEIEALKRVPGLEARKRARSGSDVSTRDGERIMFMKVGATWYEVNPVEEARVDDLDLSMWRRCWLTRIDMTR